ncbi:MAG TPA: hypothetical protein DCO89_01775 [Clostridiales bacterium]|nr:hypothetical protein [Clostridiales bacterium]
MLTPYLGDEYDDVYIKIKNTDENLFKDLKPRLYVRNVEKEYVPVGDNGLYEEGNEYYLKFKEDNKSIFYYRTHEEYYEQSQLYRKQYETLYYVPTFYSKTRSLFENYGPEFFICPDAEISSTRFYPEIITNVNIDAND